MTRDADGLDQEDVTAVRAARAGDRAAFGALYRRHVRLVQAIVLARVPLDVAPDLVHDVFLQALRRLGTLRDPAAFAPWLCAIARHHASDWRRRRRETLALDPETPAPERTDDVGVREALEAIASLPEAYRETLLLRFVAGLPGPEIARRTGLTPGSVRVNLHRGVALLRERLREGPAHHD